MPNQLQTSGATPGKATNATPIIGSMSGSGIFGIQSVVVG